MLNFSICAGEWFHPDPKYKAHDEGVMFARERVSRLTCKGVSIGTCFRLDRGIILTWCATWRSFSQSGDKQAHFCISPDARTAVIVWSWRTVAVFMTWRPLAAS